MSYSEYTQENDYIHPSRAPEGSLHAPTPPKHPPETHSDRTFGINNQSPFSALFAPDQTYMMTTPDTWATAGGETSRFPTASGVQYDPLTFHIPRTPSSSHEAARLLPTAAGHHELFQTATVQLPTSRPLSIENGSWLDKKNGAHDGREKILPQPNDSYQPTALLPTPPVSTQTLMTQGEVREWNVEPQRQVHWRQPDILTSADHYSLSGYNDRSNTRTRKRRASANTSDATANIPEATNVARHGSMDHQPHDPTDWWKRGQSSLSESNQYSKHLSFESAMAGVHDSKRNKESYNQQEHHECPQNNDRPAKKVHPNAFFVFSSERRQKIRDEQPNIRNSDLNRLLGQEWNSLSEGSKMHYKQRSDLLKEKVNECIIPYSIPVSIISSSNGQRSSEDEDNGLLRFNTTSHHSLRNTKLTCPSDSPSHHDALFVSANNDGNSNDWQPSPTITPHCSTSNLKEAEASDTSSRAVRGGRNVVNVASHSAAAEAEALANLARDGFQMGDDPSKRLQRKANDQKPERLKRPPNAYLLFNRDMRHKILHKNANLSVAEISKLISERWNELSLEGKEHYNREAAKLKQEHMDNHPNFIYSRRSKAELAEAGYKSRPAKKRKITLSPKPLAEPKGRDPRGRKKKRLKNPTAPKHPMSGFLFYSTSVRAEIAASMQKASVGDISKVIASRWRRMSANERAPWNRKAEEDKARYAREMEDFTSSLEDEAQETQGRTNGGRAEGPRSPVELDSQTIATVAQMVNPVIRQSDMVLPPSCSHTRQYQILPATPPHSGN